MSIRVFFLAVSLISFAVGQAAVAEDSATQTRKPFGGKPHAIPGKIEAENYDEGQPGEAYHDVDEPNHGADYRGETQVDIEKRADASNGHGIGWTKTGEWVSYSVIVKESGSYDVLFPVASNKKGGTFHLEIDGKDVSGPIGVPDTGAWTKLKVIKKEGIQLEAGTYVLKMVMDSEGKSGFVGDIDLMEFVKAKR